MGRQRIAACYCACRRMLLCCLGSEVIEPDPPNRAIVTPKSYSDNFTWKGPKGRDFPDLYVPPPPPPPPPKE